MKIPLNQFEQIIDETILKRGLNYFKKGFIKEFTEISHGEYEASVAGTEMYLVQLEIKNNVIVEHNCDCPYDMGAVCKHVVAAIFYHQQDVLDLKNAPKKPRAKRGTGKKTTAQLLKDIFKQTSHEDLEGFIRKNIKGNRQFRTLFLASFAHLNQNQSKEFYRGQIKPMIKAAAGREGWISPSNMNKLDKALTPFWDSADKFVETQDFAKAILIHTAMMEEMADAQRNYLEEYEVSVDEFIEYSASKLMKIVKMELPNETRIDFFDYCIEAFKKRFLTQKHHRLLTLVLANQLVREKHEVDTLIKCLHSVEKYGQKKAQRFILHLIDKFRSQEEKEEFVVQNLSNPDIRIDEIVRAINAQNYRKAKKLVQEGCNISPELEITWYEFLLKIALLEKDKSQIILYAKSLFVNAYDFDKQYYSIMKKTVEKDKWDAFVRMLIKSVKTRKIWGGSLLVREIYIQEKNWKELFNYVKEHLSLKKLAENEKYLAADYKDELVELYSTEVIKYLNENMGRSAYKTTCRYLRRMKKLGGGDTVKKLIDLFRESYPKRRALLEELNQV